MDDHPEELQPPKRMKCNKAYEIKKKYLDEFLKNLKSLNNSDARVTKFIDSLEKRIRNMCINDCSFCLKETTTVYEDRDKKKLDKIMYNKHCVGKDEIAMIPGFTKNSCKKITEGELYATLTSMMTSRSLPTDQLNKNLLGTQNRDMEMCSCSEDGCNDGPIYKPTGYLYIFALSSSVFGQGNNLQ